MPGTRTINTALIISALACLCLFSSSTPAQEFVNIEALQVTHVTALPADQWRVPEIVKRRCQSIAMIDASDGGGSSQRGSASYLGEGLWLSNAHVALSGGRPLNRYWVHLKDGRKLPAELLKVEYDQEPDLALFRTMPVELEPVPIADSGVGEGSIVFCSGFDKGDMTRHRVWPSRVTKIYYDGSIESAGTGRRTGSISGNSGGPTFNLAGELISSLNANGGRAEDTQTGRGTTITVCWRRTRLFLLPWREQIVRALERVQQCQPGYSCPPSYSAPPAYASPQQPSNSLPDYSEVIPPSFQPQAPTEFDYEQLAAALLPKMAADERFRGPPGQDGERGPQGEAGPAGQMTQSQVAQVSSTLLAALRADPTFRGPAGPAGPMGDGKRRVIIMSDGRVVDDETYSTDEPIVFDLQRIVKQAK